MQKSQKTRGAISMFLVLILVPCLFITTIFTDVGRLYMSKTMAESSADLALNSLMTNYDSDLNEWYGLVASCQNIDEFYEVSAKFFLRTLSSQNLSDDELKLLTDYYASTTGDDTIHDLLKVQCESETKSMVKAVEGADLSNPTLMKRQVVEFMKYRAPIELTVNLIDRIKANEQDIRNAIEADDNKALVEEKKEYFEAEGELLKAAFNTYWALMEYHESTQELELDNSKLQSYQDQINGYKDVYKEINKLIISNLYNTTGLKQYSRVTMSLNSYSYDKEDVYSRTETKQIEKKDENGNTYTETRTDYYISGRKIESLLTSLDSKISAFETALGNFESKAQNLVNKMPAQGSDTNEIQWWVQMDEAVNSLNGNTNEVSTKADAMLKAYAKVLAIDDCIIENASSTWRTTKNSLVSEVRTLQGTYLTSGVKPNDKNSYNIYLNAVNKLEEVSKNNISNILSTNLTVTVDGQQMNLDEALSHMASQLSAIKTEMSTHITMIDHVIWGNREEDVVSLTKLKELAKTYHDELSDWETEANRTNPDTDMKEKDREEIETKIKVKDGSDGGEVAEAITEESVSELNQRLANIKGQLQLIRGGINRMTYSNTAITDIQTASKMKSCMGRSLTIPLYTSEIKTLAADTFTEKFRPIDNEKIIALEESKMKDPDYNLTINPRSGEVETPKLFVYLYSKFQGKTKDEVQNKQAEIDAAKDKAQQAEKDLIESLKRYNGGGDPITKEYSGEETYSLGGSLQGFIELFKTLLDGNPAALRDDLYVTTYIMEMFSYGTFENEGHYNLMKKKDGKEAVTALDLSNYPTKYAKYDGSKDKEGTWLSENPKDHFNKSLRNKLINKENNKAYCAEVEYILYGHDAAETLANELNVREAYGQIFAFRYILNTVSGFQHFWARGNTTANAINDVSGFISAATQGIVPAGVVKTVMILLLTVMETGSDMNRLEAGFPVEMYKTEYTQWWYSMPGGEEIKDPKENTGRANPDQGFFYSDYLVIFVYLGLNSDAEEDMYRRMAEVMQNNIGKKAGEGSTYSLSKAKVYFTIDAKLRVEPLMMALPLFQEYTDGIDLEGDWCTYTIDTTRGYS